MELDGLLRQLQTDLLTVQSAVLQEELHLARPVPSCPEWTVADLLGHLWSVQTWVREILRTREVASEREPSSDPRQAVADFVDGVPDYLTAMRAINPDEPCWNFGPPPRLAGFWIRRQAHEHAIHRVDLETAAGADTPTFDSPFAADGVDEILSMFYPRQVRLGRTEPAHDTVRLLATDTGDHWTVGSGEPTAILRSDAQTLYLGLWKRLDLLDAANVDGDRGAVERVLSLALTP